MFTLAIYCLTTSNLPWFMDLTFQVPMQYYSLQHQTLLPSPDTSTTRRCFHFGSASSFFLELFLHSSPVAYWAPTDLGSPSFSVLLLCHLYSYSREFYCYVLKAGRGQRWFSTSHKAQDSPHHKELLVSHVNSTKVEKPYSRRAGCVPVT